MALRCAAQVGGEGALDFGHADGKMTLSLIFPFLKLLANCAVRDYFIGALDFLGDDFDLRGQADFIVAEVLNPSVSASAMSASIKDVEDRIYDLKQALARVFG